jgi:hypothetical protein
MSFKQEMARRKALALQTQDKKYSTSTIFTATPLIKVQAKAASFQCDVPLLQKIKEGKDLVDLRSVMDIRLLKCTTKEESEIHPAVEEFISEGSFHAEPTVEIPIATSNVAATFSVDCDKKKVRLKNMQDLLEILPEKSCEEFLYDCIPQLLTNQSSKDSANFFQRRDSSTPSVGKFYFADVYAQYPAEKKRLESSLKNASESGSVQSDISASISLKTSKALVAANFNIDFGYQSSTSDVESLGQASSALQPALRCLFSCDPATAQRMALFEAVQQQQWWCTASRCSASCTVYKSISHDDHPSVLHQAVESDAQHELRYEESASSSSEWPLQMHTGDLVESSGVNSIAMNAAEIESPSGTVEQALSPEELVQEGIVSELYEQACKVLCTPVIDFLHRHPFVKFVNVSHMSLLNSGISSLAVIIMNSPRIELIDVFNNGITHVGLRHLCSSLLESTTIRDVRLDCNPLGPKGAMQLSGALCCNRLNTSIETLSLSGCKLGDDGCAAIIKSLLGAVNIKSLNLSLNGAEIETAKAAADVLPLISSLERLSLRWNEFRSSAAVVFCQGAMNNRSIMDMDLSCNSFGEVNAVSYLGEALKVMNHLKNLDVSYNRIDGRGAYILGNALEINHHISNCNFSGNPIGMLGARALSQLVLATGVEQSSKKCRKIKLENCSIHYVDASLFDPSKTSGKYQLDLSDNYSRIVIGSILRMLDSNQGEILQGSIKMNGEIIAKLTWKEDTIPPKGFLQFQFESIHHFPPRSEDCLSSKQVSSIKELLRPCTDDQTRLAVFAMLTGNDDYFSLDQVKEIMEMFRDSLCRGSFALLVLFQIAPIQPESLLQHILNRDDFEAKSITGMSTYVRDFTIFNPTGHYRLNLDCSDDQRLMDLLLKIRSAVKQRRKVFFRAQKCPSIRSDLEWCILNTKWNGKDVRVLSGWMPPSQGVLDFDFIANLQLSKVPIEHHDFCFRMGDCNCDKERLIMLRHLSNSFCFRTETALFFLEGISCQQILVDCMIVFFDSVYEIPGFQFMLSKIGPSSRDNVIRLLGIHNIWNRGCVVAYHVFDLSDFGHRFVCQQLIALAHLESGASLVDVHFENKSFSIPSHWQDAMPMQGICSFFFSRQQSILDDYYSSFGQRALDVSCWKLFQPSGTDWIHARKRGNIKDRIKEKFSSPEAAFQSMDIDGGGSLSRVELSIELRKLGIWLQVTIFVCLSLQRSSQNAQPHEAEHLMSILDEDNGGTIEKEEFVNFWNSC